jgi:hypothetical protein
MQTIFEKCPFKENGKLSKSFRLILWGLNLTLGSDSPQNKSCEVSDPAEQHPAGYQTPRNQVLRDIRPRRTMTEMCIFYSRGLFCVVWYSAEQRPAGPDTLPNKVLHGIRPSGTKFCRVSHIPGNNFKYEYFRKFETGFKNILGCDSGTIWGRFVKKTRGRKSCATVLLTDGIFCWLLLKLFSFRSVSWADCLSGVAEQLAFLLWLARPTSPLALVYAQ